MPSASVIEVRPPIRSGRPTEAASSRSNTRSSIGSTWYFSACCRKTACSSASFCGFFAARSFARLKSERVSYSCHAELSSSVRRGLASHGARWIVRAYQPSW